MSVVDRLLRRLAGVPPDELHTISGIRVVVQNSREDILTADVLSRLGEALELIERHQPWRMAHLRRDLRQILVLRYPCRGAYLPADRTCITELTFLARRDIGAGTVASSILHEGMHARVHRMGVTREGHDMAREERLCRRAELEFGLALPAEQGAPVIQRARESLALVDEDVAPAIDWNVALERQAAVDRAAVGDRATPKG